MEDCEDTIKGCEGPEGAWRTVRTQLRAVKVQRGHGGL